MQQGLEAAFQLFLDGGAHHSGTTFNVPRALQWAQWHSGTVAVVQWYSRQGEAKHCHRNWGPKQPTRRSQAFTCACAATPTTSMPTWLTSRLVLRYRPPTYIVLRVHLNSIPHAGCCAAVVISESQSQTPSSTAASNVLTALTSAGLYARATVTRGVMCGWRWQA